MLAFTFLASLAAGLLSGFVPALQAGRDNLISSLRERGATTFGGVRLRKSIVTLQVAFSLVLVVVAALFLRTLSSLLVKGPGFDTASLVSFSLEPLKNGYSAMDSGRLIERIHDAVRALPVTRDLGLARNELLTGGSWGNRVTIQTERRFVADRRVDLNAVSSGFFTTLNVRLLAGRYFDQRDSRIAAQAGPRAAIVNRAFVRRYLASGDPLGVLIGVGSGPDVKTDIAIVGVVSDFNYRGLREQSEQAFFPLSANRNEDFSAAFYVKLHGTSDLAFQMIRKVVRDADPRLPILGFHTVDEQVTRSLNTERMLAFLSGTFGVLALLLSLIGLYGVMSFVVTRRTREIGIRLALGATTGSAIRLILSDAVTMIVAGIAIAIPCVAALGKLVQSQLFGVTATDPATVAGSAMVLVAGALLAAFIPAWRASRISPTDALRLD